jgi:Flp pilus assembly protein TadG
MAEGGGLLRPRHLNSPHQMTRRRHIHSIRSEQGQAAVEFALVVPALIALLLGILQCGIAFSHYLTVTDAARAGARKAVLLRVGNLTTADVTQAVQAATPDLSQAQLGVAVSDATDPTFSQAGSTVTVTVTYPYSINVLGWVVSSGNLTSTMSERVE